LNFRQSQQAETKHEPKLSHPVNITSLNYSTEITLVFMSS